MRIGGNESCHLFLFCVISALMHLIPNLLMKYLLALCFIASIVSCRNENTSGKHFSTDSLPAQQFTINTERDTTLQTNKGALLKIPKGAIVPANGSSATLEIKEAYSIEDMILGGLTTNSDGQPLSSGGMIYINAAAGQNLKFTQPVKVAIPTDFFVDGMQLYKGDTTDGTINWTNPQPLPITDQMKTVDKGEILFQQNCSSCHGIGKVISGPDLAHFKNRLLMSRENEGFDADRNILMSFHNNWVRNEIAEDEEMKHEAPGAVDSTQGHDEIIARVPILHPNLYACNLQRMFGTIGPQFPELKKADWQAIFDFIQTESDRKELPLPEQAYLAACIDSCKLYSETVGELKKARSKTEMERRKLVEDNGRMVENKIVNPPVVNPVPVIIEDKVSPQSFGAEYYQFTIEGFGWYNIDILAGQLDGVEESELIVRVRGEYREKVELYLVIPSSKIYTQAGPTEKNKDEYAFYTKDGKLPLPQGAKSYILALTESGGNFAFALHSFNAAKQQTIEIELKKSTKKEFRKAMKVFAKQDLKIRLQDAENADEIRIKDADLKAIDRQIEEAENLKPKGCNCDCGNAYRGDSTKTISK